MFFFVCYLEFQGNFCKVKIMGSTKTRNTETETECGKRNTHKTVHLQIPEQPTLAAYSADITTTLFTVLIKLKSMILDMPLSLVSSIMTACHAPYCDVGVAFKKFPCPYKLLCHFSTPSSS